MKKIIVSLCVCLLATKSFAHTDKESEPRVHLATIKVLGESESTEILEGAPVALKVGGDELQRIGKSSLGETLRGQPGVHSTDFGAEASRPVIRGFGGERVKILQNGIGLLDASAVSEDHAVPISPLNSDSIEIIRGPMNLLYGSSAIGGVVNVSNSRIHGEYFEGFSGAADAKFDSARDYRRTGLKLDYGKSNLVYHFDGEISKSGLLQVPEGEIVNSQSQQHTFGGGVTYFTESKNSFGLSYSNYDNNYGVVLEEAVTIDLNQQRFDFSGNIKIGGFLKELRIKSAQTSYEHTEFEGDEVGTVFENSGNETRFELVQNESKGLTGIFGVQASVSEFSAVGDEAYLPPVDTMNIAAFAYEKLATKAADFSLGLRLETVDYEAAADEQDFFAPSLAFAVKKDFADSYFWEINTSYTERAPSFQELYSNGGHVATSQFEIGNIDLEKEKSIGVEISVGKQTKDFEGKFTVFAQSAKNFISLNPTAEPEEDDLPVYRYAATDAEFFGLELEALVHLNSNFDLKLVGDYLYGKDTEADQSLPRTAPARLSAELVHEWGKLRSNVKVAHTFEQSKVAPEEDSTDGFTMVSLGTSYEMMSQGRRYQLYAQINNIFDEEARNHISRLKNQMPFPGLAAVVGVQAYF